MAGSDRNGWRHQIGTGGAITSESAALGTGFTSGVDPRDIALWEVDAGLSLRLDGGALARLQQMRPRNSVARGLATCTHMGDLMSCMVVLEARAKL